MTEAPDGWAVAKQPPQGRRTTRPRTSPMHQLITQALETGKPYARTFPDTEEAKSYVRLLRKKALQHEARVSIRTELRGQECTVTMTISKR